MNVKTSLEMSKDISKPEQLITEHIDIWTSTILAKSSSGRGSNKKYELYGIGKLRGLIFDLAVRGKLVIQDSNDEPASKLIERIVTRKLSQIHNDEKIFALPLGWSWIKLEDIAEINGGFAFKSSDYTSDGIRVIRISDFNEMGFKNDKVVRYPYSVDLERYRLEEENILMAMTGGTVGKSLLVQALPEPMVVNQRVATIKLLQGIDSTYINSLIRSELIQSVINEAKNSTNDNISMKSINNFMIPLPPSAEQHRIVAKVDELMLLCDQLEQQTEASIEAHARLVEVLLATLTDSADTDELAQNWARISEHFDSLFTTEQSIDTLKQTVLKLAVMGKLVPQNPDDEPASVLLEKIAEEKEQLIKEKKIKKENPLPAITDEEKPFELPQGWTWCHFGVLFKSLTNGLYKPEKFYSDTGVISLRMYNIQDGLINFDSARRVNINDEELDRYLLEEGDLLINRVNSKELVGKTAIIPPFEEHLVYESMNMRGKVFQNYLNPSYLNLFMRSELAKVALIGHAKEAVGQASINQTQIRTLVTPLPPLAEQHRIVAKVDELMAICDQLKEKLKQSQETQVQLTDALVDRALG